MDNLLVANKTFMRLSGLFITLLILAAAPTPVSAQDDAVLRNPDPGDWLRWRGDHSAAGYSPLEQVNRQNVSRLALAWAWPMEDGQQEPEPIVYKGVMYLPHSNNVVQALNARTGELIWEYRRELPENTRVNGSRNIAIYQDKIFLGTLDGYLVALGAKTGNVVWETQVTDSQERSRYTAGPIAADGKIFAGLSCGASTPIPCYMTAHDAATGKQLWRREAIAGPGDPEEHNATWGGVPYEERKKGSFWLTGSYDPDLKLVYWTTGSPSPYPEILRGSGDGAVLYTNSLLALEAETGAIRWFFQMLPRDNFDLDHQDNPILADVEVRGIQRKVVYTLGKSGILWALDRETGEHLWNRQLVTYQNVYQDIDPETGAITLNEQIVPREVRTSQLVCPGMRGGKLFQTDAYNPRTNMLYSPVTNECIVFEILPVDVSVSGLNYGQIQHMQGSAGLAGRLAAVSGSTGQILWTYDQRAGIGSVLTTGGGLVFAGDFYRYFRAFDAQSGKVLWELPLSGPVTGYPISYAVDGKQYVAVGAGEGTGGQRHIAQLYPELKAPAGSNILMVFALGE